jgi:chitin synthase
MAYDIVDYWGTAHPNVSNVAKDPFMSEIAGKDLSFLFPKLTPSCKDRIPRSCKINAVYPEAGQSKGIKEFCHDPRALKEVKPIGSVYFEWSDIKRPDSKRFAFNGYAVDMAPYFASNTTQWISAPELELITQHFGRDATVALGVDSNLRSLANCLVEAYGIGKLENTDFLCYGANVILWISLIVISAVVIIRFILAVAFSWTLSSRLGRINDASWYQVNRKVGKIEIAQPGTGVTAVTHPQSFSLFSKVDLSYRYRELYTLCLVTCYSEDEVGLRATMDSLSETVH